MRGRGLLVAGVVAAASCANALIYTFDSDNQGWREADFNSSTLALTIVGSSKWNPAGYLDENDFAGWAFNVSPDLGGGYQGSDAISFDMAYNTVDGQPYPFVVLSTATDGIYMADVPIADGKFHHYSYALTAGAWVYSDGVNFHTATQNEIDSVLTNLKLIGIDNDMLTGGDLTQLDNVQLGAVPEPMTLAALAGMAALVRARKRRA